MSNINYTLGKDFLVFTGIDPNVIYYLQGWDGLGFTGGDTQTSSPYGPIYNPGDIIVYNTLSCTFIIDENWKVFETLQNMALKNAPLDGSSYDPTITTIDLHIMNNTVQKEIGYVRLNGGYVQSVMNVTHNYNVSDNTTPPMTMNVIIKYQNHMFYRNSDA